MDCATGREALSARLDGEDDADERSAVDAHLAGCAACAGWYDDAAAVTRLARTGLALHSPGVDRSVLDAAPGRGRARAALLLRGVLGALGLVQFVLGVAQINTYALVGPAHLGGHLWHESAAWNVALGAGFTWIALRRTRPVSLLPVLTAFVATLTLLSLNDVWTGRVDTGRLLSHGFVVAGYVIVALLARPVFDFTEPPSGRTSGWSRWRFHSDADEGAGVPVAPVALPGITARADDGRRVA